VSGPISLSDNQACPGFSVEHVQHDRDPVLVLRGEFDLSAVQKFAAAVAGVTPTG
jgi:hypothetical protein